jgi:hypothetical protein
MDVRRSQFVNVIAGESVTIPIEILKSELPEGTLAFECVIETNPELLDIVSLDRTSGMVGQGLSEFNNSPTMFDDVAAGIVSKSFKGSHSPARVGVVCANVVPLQGALMFNLVGTGKANAKAVVTCTFLTLGTEIVFGSKPAIYQLVDGNWTIREG